MISIGILTGINLEYNVVLLAAGYDTYFIEVYLLSVREGKATLCACITRPQHESLRVVLAKTR